MRWVFVFCAVFGIAFSQADSGDLVTVQDGGIALMHRAAYAPGDPVLVRVHSSEMPVVVWGVGRAAVEEPGQGPAGTLLEGEMRLAMVRDGTDWVGVGRDILGTPSEVVQIEARVGGRVLRSSLELRSGSKKAQFVAMPKSVLATRTDENRARELAVLQAAHSKAITTAKLWTKSFVAPLVSHEISPFGQARVYEQGGALNFHYGTDLAGKVGTPIVATNDGEVLIAGCYAIRGCLTGINHGAGLVSLYFHQSSILVKLGQRVVRGQRIGKVGATGFANGPHLHWEMRVLAEGTDPRQWLGKIWP